MIRLLNGSALIWKRTTAIDMHVCRWRRNGGSMMKNALNTAAAKLALGADDKSTRRNVNALDSVSEFAHRMHCTLTTLLRHRIYFAHPSVDPTKFIRIYNDSQWPSWVRINSVYFLKINMWRFWLRVRRTRRTNCAYRWFGVRCSATNKQLKKIIKENYNRFRCVECLSRMLPRWIDMRMRACCLLRRMNHQKRLSRRLGISNPFLELRVDKYYQLIRYAINGYPLSVLWRRLRHQHDGYVVSCV